MKTPCGLLAPLEECSFKLEAEDRERLEELRREKVEKALEGKLDKDQVSAGPARKARKAAVSRIKKVDPNEGDGIGDDWAPGEFEAFCARMQAEQADLKRATIRAMKWTPKGGAVDTTAGNGVLRLNGSIGSNEPTDVEQRVLDYCHRVAPEGCRPVTSEEIGRELGYSTVGAWKIADRLRKKGLWLDGWTSRGRPSKAVVQVEPREAAEPPPPKKPPAEKLAKVEAPAPVSTVDAPPPDSPAARSIVAHSTKYRITADERRAREAHAEREMPVACEVRAKAEPEPEPAADPRRQQVGGDHYTRLAVQPWDVIEATFGPEGIYAYFAGNVVKYLMRAHFKGGLEDLRKARHYLGRLITLVEQGKAACGKVTQPEDEQ